jgi:diaminobutyrate-2-oxoglutarate transaminase
VSSELIRSSDVSYSDAQTLLTDHSNDAHRTCAKASMLKTAELRVEISQDQHSAIEFLAGKESNARTYARVFDRILVRGASAKVWDADGNIYTDLLACAGALPLGHNHPYVTQRVTEFLNSGQILQALDIATPAKVEFLKQLWLALPGEFAKDARVQFCGPTGSDAVEAAMKLFKSTTGRRSVLAFHGGYHGMTLGSLSLMGNVTPKSAVSGLTPEVHFLPYPNSARCPFGVGGEAGEDLILQYIDNVLCDPESGITKPAMMILEAVQGEGGCIPASNRWLHKIREITLRHDVPLVVDEVQTGFGRTGSMFAHEDSGIVPDAIVLSKALGGGFPMALLCYNKKYDTWAPGTHAGTFRGNQIAMVSGAATLQFIREHKIPKQVQELGNRLQDRLRILAREFDCIGDIRGRGLMVGAEIVQPSRGKTSAIAPLDGELAKLIKRECFTRGVIIETGGRFGAVLRFLPPLTISGEEIDEAMGVLRASIASASKKYAKSPTQ